jgi:AraC-like DNA-binding protein
MDPLSTVLALLKPRSAASGGFDAGGDWSVRFRAHQGIKCIAVVSGEGWFRLEGEADAMALRPGDCLLLPSGRPFVLASARGAAANPPPLNAPPLDAVAAFGFPLDRRIAVLNGGGDFLGLGGHFLLERQAELLLDVLPPVVRLERATDRAAMRWSLEQMREELAGGRPGGDLIAQQLASVMLVQALRLYLTERAGDGTGWLSALADPQIGAAMAAIHDDPAAPWTLEALARRAGLSRSGFAARFRALVGAPPGDYLTRWRMRVAADRLGAPGVRLAEVAAAVGYESENAFSTAFRRVMGVSPRRWARARG